VLYYFHLSDSKLIENDNDNTAVVSDIESDIVSAVQQQNEQLIEQKRQITTNSSGDPVERFSPELFDFVDASYIGMNLYLVLQEISGFVSIPDEIKPYLMDNDLNSTIAVLSNNQENSEYVLTSFMVSLFCRTIDSFDQGMSRRILQEDFDNQPDLTDLEKVTLSNYQQEIAASMQRTVDACKDLNAGTDETLEAFIKRTSESNDNLLIKMLTNIVNRNDQTIQQARQYNQETNTPQSKFLLAEYLLGSGTPEHEIEGLELLISIENKTPIYLKAIIGCLTNRCKSADLSNYNVELYEQELALLGDNLQINRLKTKYRKQGEFFRDFAWTQIQLILMKQGCSHNISTLTSEYQTTKSKYLRDLANYSKQDIITGSELSEQLYYDNRDIFARSLNCQLQ
jgi:hypothetical protein